MTYPGIGRSELGAFSSLPPDKVGRQRNDLLGDLGQEHGAGGRGLACNRQLFCDQFAYRNTKHPSEQT